MKQKLTEMKGEIDKYKIIVGDFRTHYQHLIELIDRKPTMIWNSTTPSTNKI